MQEINVIDLDSTLLPYDSYGKLVKNELKKINLYTWLMAILRVLRIISSCKFKELLIKYWENKYDISFFTNYANAIYNDLDKTVHNVIVSKTGAKTKNILISASPDLYVKEVILLLGWEGSGSYFEKDEFINLYSLEKLNWLAINYPRSNYVYNFAISDSYSDEPLLALFKESVLLV